MRYKVTAGYATVETAVPGGRAQVDIPRGQLLPDDVPVEQVETLVGRGDVEPVDEPAAEPVDETPGPGAADGKIEDILARVGDDKAKAQEALDAEQAKPKPRTTLVAALSEIVGPPAPPAE